MNPATKQYLKEHGPVRLVALYLFLPTAIQHCVTRRSSRQGVLNIIIQNRPQKGQIRFELA